MGLAEEDLQRATRFLRSALERLDRVPSYIMETDAQAALGLLAGTAGERLKAILLLIEGGFLAEAKILLRSMVDLVISGAFIFYCEPSVREVRGDLFFASDLKLRTRFLDRMDTRLPRFAAALNGDEELSLKLADIRSRAAAVFLKGDTWSGLSAAAMVAAVEDPEAQSLLELLYVMGFSAMSNYVHPTWRGTNHAIDPRPSAVDHFVVPAIAGLAAGILYEVAARSAGVAQKDEILNDLRPLLEPLLPGVGGLRIAGLDLADFAKVVMGA